VATTPRRIVDRPEICRGHGVILVDGSWGATENAGVATVVYDEEDKMAWVRCDAGNASDSYQVEANAIWEACQWIRGHSLGYGWRGVTIVSDCLQLVQAIVEGRPDECPSWKARGTARLIMEMLRSGKGNIWLEHSHRETLQAPHLLANWIRRIGGTYDEARPPTVLEQGSQEIWKLDTWFIREPD
jgi:ribonuclease HI